jgi:DNA processing protein
MTQTDKNEDRKYYLGFSYFNKIGPVNMKRLQEYFPDLKTAFEANSLDLEKSGLNGKLISEFLAWRPSCCLEKILSQLAEEKINFVTWADQEYPPLLKEISAPPPILYYKGVIDGEPTNRLAVVGSRKHSAYAEKVIAALLPTLIKAKIEIVSGLALGVDSLAHQEAVKQKGRTLAVLGSGLSHDNIYPSSNRHLAEEIIAGGGVLLSEFPPDTPPYKQNFPQRNRIISGLARATMVIEAKGKSGSLITANYALEQNREVLTVPGNIFSEFSAGPNELIKAGAKTITSAADILEIFNFANYSSIAPTPTKKTKNYQPENDVETKVYDLIKLATERGEKITTDEIIEKSQLDTATINSTLSILEIKEVAENDGSGYALK